MRSLITFIAGTVIAVGAWIAAAGLAWPEPGQGAAPGASAKLTKAQRLEVNRVLAQLRTVHNDDAQSKALVKQVTEMGPQASAALFAGVNKEMAPLLKRYASKFQQQAAVVAKKRSADIDVKEVAQLRRSVLGLSSAPNFSKDLIIQVGDPALERLEEILVVRREEVLENHQDLQDHREKLMPWGKIWEQCAISLYDSRKGADNSDDTPPTFEAYLRGAESLAAQQSMPMDQRTRAVMAANDRLIGQLDPEEGNAILALNLMRTLLGLAPLAIDLRLCAAARMHSKDMVENDFFAHESPLPGKTKPPDRARLFRTTCRAENICQGLMDGRRNNVAWFHSPGHHINQLLPSIRVGVGRHEDHFTQMFGD